MVKSPADPELFRLSCDAVKEGLDHIAEKKRSGESIGQYSSFFKLARRKNGMPSFETDFDPPIDYKRAFDTSFSALRRALGGGEPAFDFRKRPAFQRVLQHIKYTPILWNRTRASHSSDAEFRDSTAEIEVALFLEYQIDRYIHVYESTEFSGDLLLALYLPLETEFSSDKLEVNVWVPVLFLNCEVHERAISDSVSITRIPDEFQLARASSRPYAPAVNDSVLGAATHALVLRSYWLPNSAKDEWALISSQASTP
jgi:hypothetical protein